MALTEYPSNINPAYLEPDPRRERFQLFSARAGKTETRDFMSKAQVEPSVQKTQRASAEPRVPLAQGERPERERPHRPNTADDDVAHMRASSAGGRQKRLKHIKRVVDAKGIERFYYGRGGKPYIRLVGALGSTAFRESYAAAKQTKTLIWKAAKTPVEPARSFHRLVDRYLCGPNFQQLSPRTQRVYRRVLDRLMRSDDLGAKPVTGLTPAQIRRMLAKRHDTPAAASDALKKLRILMRFAMALRWRSDDPTRGIDLRHVADTNDGRRPRRRRPTGPATARRRQFSESSREGR